MRHVLFTFNIECKPLMCNERAKLTVYNRDFVSWLREFVKRNNIRFPYIDTFFDVLILSSLKKLSPEDSIRVEKPAEYIAKTRGVIESMFGDKEEEPLSLFEKQSTDSVEGSSSLAPSTIEFKGTISLGEVSDTEAQMHSPTSVRSLHIEEIN